MCKRECITDCRICATCENGIRSSAWDYHNKDYQAKICLTCDSGTNYNPLSWWRRIF